MPIQKENVSPVAKCLVHYMPGKFYLCERPSIARHIVTYLESVVLPRK